MQDKHHSEITRAKISRSRKKNPTRYWLGKHLSKEHIKKLSGSNNYGWKGGLSFLPYPAEFSRQLKELIRQRDNYQCQKCGMPECEEGKKLSVHHVDYEKQNVLPSNLISLCRRCNTEVNYNREYWERYFEVKIERKEVK